MDNKKSIQIYVALKNIGKVTRRVQKYPFVLYNTPSTLRELIRESVISCIESYKVRAESGKRPVPLTEEQINSMQTVGKIAFGVHYNDNRINEEKAINTALEAVTDGLVRIFKGKDELTDLDKRIDIAEGDELTFIRLTMLSGIMW